jgi:hypothetical protein
MLSEYRQRFGEFHTHIGREDYQYRAGLKAASEAEFFHRDYADLFSKENLAGFRRLREETPAYREADLASLRRLIAFSIEGQIERAASALSREIESYERAQRIPWKEEKLTLGSARSRLAEETDAAQRGDLFLRWADRIRNADDLRAERLTRMHAATKELGFENAVAMRSELREIDLAGLRGKAERFLSLTESAYVSRFSMLLPQSCGVTFGESTQAELSRFFRFTDFDLFFSRDRMQGIYRELFQGLGFDPARQNNLRLDPEPRAQKQSHAFCAPIAVPEEIILSYQIREGQENYRDFFTAAGHAQHFAWTSRNLPPEFRILTQWGDRAAQESWGFLLQSLMLDRQWLMGTVGFLESGKFLERLACMRLLSMRWNAAMSVYETGAYASGTHSVSADRYAERMSDATRVRYDGTGRLRDLDDFFLAADRLRAFAFEAQFRDYLKTRYGARWWTSRKAGEMLIDLWNIGQRHSVEELAGMIGLGELDYDSLASEAISFTKYPIE